MIITFFEDIPVHTITCVNGRESAVHEAIADQLNVKVYFNHSYVFWERGTKENTNGLIRHYIQKRTKLKKITNKDIRFFENRLNTRPRKCLLFKPTVVVFNNHGCTSYLNPKYMISKMFFFIRFCNYFRITNLFDFPIMQPHRPSTQFSDFIG